MLEELAHMIVQLLTIIYAKSLRLRKFNEKREIDKGRLKLSSPFDNILSLPPLRT